DKNLDTSSLFFTSFGFAYIKYVILFGKLLTLKFRIKPYKSRPTLFFKSQFLKQKLKSAKHLKSKTGNISGAWVGSTPDQR
ncbi:MAG: hypothetical protein K2X47_19555, partial [Bdellovibrionales bacterium]|nr:hypothetical protein [Bdellovibrionales bacterium]